MILGIKNGNIKTKSDAPKGLRAVECACCCEGPTSGKNVFQITKEEYDAYLKGGTWNLSGSYSGTETTSDGQGSNSSGSFSGSGTTSGCSGGVSASGSAFVEYTYSGGDPWGFDYEISGSISYELGSSNNSYFIKITATAHEASSEVDSSFCGYPSSVTLTVDGNSIEAYGTWCPGWQGSDGYTNTSTSTLTASFTPNV